MFVFVPSPPPPSPEAVALGNRIAEAVRLLRRENAAITGADVKVALRLAEDELRAELGQPNHQLTLVIAGLVAMLAFGFMAYLIAGGQPPTAVVVLAVIVSILAVGAVFVMRRR